MLCKEIRILICSRIFKWLNSISEPLPVLIRHYGLQCSAYTGGLNTGEKYTWTFVPTILNQIQFKINNLIFKCLGCVLFWFIFLEGIVTIAANQANNNSRNEFLVGRKTWTDPSDCPLYARWHARACRCDAIFTRRQTRRCDWTVFWVRAELFLPPSFSLSLPPSAFSILSNRGYTTTDSNTLANMWLHCAKLSLCSAASGGIRVALWARAEQASASRVGLCLWPSGVLCVIGVFPCGRLSSDGTSRSVDWGESNRTSCS